jgi:hypothetical protein
MIRGVSDLQQVSVLLRVFRLPSPMTDHHNITEIFLKVALQNMEHSAHFQIEDKYEEIVHYIMNKL